MKSQDTKTFNSYCGIKFTQVFYYVVRRGQLVTETNNQATYLLLTKLNTFFQKKLVITGEKKIEAFFALQNTMEMLFVQVQMLTMLEMKK